jgi:hypothetical protein
VVLPDPGMPVISQVLINLLIAAGAVTGPLWRTFLGRGANTTLQDRSFTQRSFQLCWRSCGGNSDTAG